MRLPWFMSSRQSARRTTGRTAPKNIRPTPQSSSCTGAERATGHGSRASRTIGRNGCLAPAFPVLRRHGGKTRRGRENMARVVLADDHPLYLQALKEAVEQIGIDVVGLATRGDDLVELMQTVETDA